MQIVLTLTFKGPPHSGHLHNSSISFVNEPTSNFTLVAGGLLLSGQSFLASCLLTSSVFDSEELGLYVSYSSDAELSNNPFFLRFGRPCPPCLVRVVLLSQLPGRFQSDSTKDSLRLSAAALVLRDVFGSLMFDMVFVQQ